MIEIYPSNKFIGDGYLGKSDHLVGKKHYVNWTKCRDVFQEWGVLDEFFFATASKKHIPYILRFIHNAEKKLGLEDHTRFHETSKPRIIYIKPAPFWMENPMRRSLLTAMLRCGHDFRKSKNNFKETLHSSKYLKNTKKALKLFFEEGKTVFVNPFGPYGYLSGSYGWQKMMPSWKPYHKTCLVPENGQ